MRDALKVWSHRRALQWVRDVYDHDRGTMNGGAFLQQAAWARQA